MFAYLQKAFLIIDTIMETDYIDTLRSLFTDWAQEEGIEVVPIPQSGSYRQYFRLTGQNKQAIGVYSPEKGETLAFISFTKHFRQMGLNVPELYLTNTAKDCYLISDLGDVSLLDHLEKNRVKGNPSAETYNYYRMAIAELPRFQVDASKNLNFLLCYPTGSFDGKAMRWDLNYFKYYFLRLLKIPFNEAALENDFDRLIVHLLQTESHYFMYRDFQARNILIHDGKLGFIDYQGGRRGPLQYDLASLLFQVKASLPYHFREEMLQWYLQNLKKFVSVNEKKFVESYFGFVLIRLLQVMGAYGFRGYYERKGHFLQSIPYAIENIGWLISNVKFRIEMPELLRVLHEIAKIESYLPDALEKDSLTVAINSFSYKNGPPADYSGNGGGFVFDCRALPNPGRFDDYKRFTGLEVPIILFFDREPVVAKFLQNTEKIVGQSILEYQRRGFNHLQVNFGCTGGRHRSVFCASKLAEFISENYSVKVVVFHGEINKRNAV